MTSSLNNTGDQSPSRRSPACSRSSSSPFRAAALLSTEAGMTAFGADMPRRLSDVSYHSINGHDLDAPRGPLLTLSRLSYARVGSCYGTGFSARSAQVVYGADRVF